MNFQDYWHLQYLRGHIKKPPKLSRFAGIDESTTHNFPECNPKCFNNKKLKEKISSKLLEIRFSIFKIQKKVEN